MIRKIALAAAASTLIAGAGLHPAHAWEVAVGQTRSGPFCYATTGGDEPSLSFTVHARNPDAPNLLVTSARWPVVPSGLPVVAEIEVDGRRATVSGSTFTAGGIAGVSIPLEGDGAAALLTAWALGNRMTVRFPNGATGVTASLAGTRDALSRLARCVEANLTRSPSPAQPPAVSRSPASPSSPSPASNPPANPGRWS